MNLMLQLECYSREIFVVGYFRIVVYELSVMTATALCIVVVVVFILDIHVVV